MTTIAELSDAAIAICRVLDQSGVKFGIFGGFAVSALGGPRGSKDIDCVVHCSKEWLVERLKSVPSFQTMGNTRPDLAKFLFGKSHVLIEFFPSKPYPYLAKIPI